MAKSARTKPHAKHHLKDWREYLGITQDRAIEDLGWSQSKISRIENFRIPLTTDDLLLAAAYYKRTTSELLHVNPFEHPPVPIDVTEVTEALVDAKATPEQIKEAVDFVTFITRNNDLQT